MAWIHVTRSEFVYYYYDRYQRAKRPTYEDRYPNRQMTDTFWSDRNGREVLWRRAWFRKDKILTIRYHVDSQWASRARGKRFAICAYCTAPCCSSRNVSAGLDPHELNGPWKKVKAPSSATGWALAKTGKGICVYFDEGRKRCRIYKKKRPLCCRLWFCGRGTDDDEIWQTIKEKTNVKENRV